MTQKTNIQIEMPADLFFKAWNSKKSKQALNERLVELILKGLKMENLR